MTTTLSDVRTAIQESFFGDTSSKKKNSATFQKRELQIINPKEFRSLSDYSDYVVCLPKAKFVEKIPDLIVLLTEDYETIDVISDAIISRITPPMTNGEPRATWLNAINSLNYSQKNAVALALVYLKENYGCRYAERALELYWHKVLIEEER